MRYQESSSSLSSAEAAGRPLVSVSASQVDVPAVLASVMHNSPQTIRTVYAPTDPRRQRALATAMLEELAPAPVPCDTPPLLDESTTAVPAAPTTVPVLASVPPAPSIPVPVAHTHAAVTTVPPLPPLPPAVEQQGQNAAVGVPPAVSPSPPSVRAQQQQSHREELREYIRKQQQRLAARAAQIDHRHNIAMARQAAKRQSAALRRQGLELKRQESMHRAASRREEICWIAREVGYDLEVVRGSRTLDSARPPADPSSTAREPDDPAQEHEDRRAVIWRTPWRPFETAALLAGMHRHAANTQVWAAVKADKWYGPVLAGRTGTDLKDRYRNLKRVATRQASMAVALPPLPPLPPLARPPPPPPPPGTT